MQDVSVRVGGLAGISFGPYASAVNLEGDINCEGSSSVLIENFSPWGFQIGTEFIPPMWRRTFGIDNYPNLHWTVSGQSAIQSYNTHGGGIGELRTVRIILDPNCIADGPVYPTPMPISGFLDVNSPLDDGVHWMIDVRDLLGTSIHPVNSAPALLFANQVKDPAILGFELMGTSDLAFPTATFLDSVTMDNIPRLGAINFGFPSPVEILNCGVGGFTSLLKGKEFTKYWSIPGYSLIAITGGPIVTGSLAFTAWCGYHL